MDAPSKQPMLVLCHTLLNDAFFYYSGGDINNWKDARFLINFLIIKKAELPENQYPAITSKKVMDEFRKKFLEKITAPRLYQIFSVLEDCIFINNKPDIEKLSDHEGVITIAETLYSHGSFMPILVSGMADEKRKMTAEFYKKYGQEKVPFETYSYGETKVYLKVKYPEIYTSADVLTSRTI